MTIVVSRVFTFIAELQVESDTESEAESEIFLPENPRWPSAVVPE